METTLGQRQGLPADLLYLSEKHPRGTWRGRSELAGAGEIWLGSHDYFRAVTAKISENLARLEQHRRNIVVFRHAK